MGNVTSNVEVAQPLQPKRQLAPKPIGLPLLDSKPMSAVDISSNKNDEEAEEKNENVIKNENANMALPLESVVSNVNVADIQQDDRDSTPMTDVDEESQSEVELDLEEDDENDDDDDDEEGTTDEEDEYSDSNDENEDEYEDEEEEDDDREHDDDEGGEGMIDL